ncbi:hypothetical protein FRX31_011528 [Thalictrum thalictroides]|uniref:Uncharacterized protein n=1 Tax=Thalictrum thalictroides TaxID=46969 RepID=A0A7J6WPM7_THATH|nr:hypothetical protein FRX31_011528 [Thalictrum thalictroides]
MNVKDLERQIKILFVSAGNSCVTYLPTCDVVVHVWRVSFHCVGNGSANCAYVPCLFHGEFSLSRLGTPSMEYRFVGIYILLERGGITTIMHSPFQLVMD